MLAISIELVGHERSTGPVDPLDCTPRQLFAYRRLAEKRIQRERAIALSIAAMAARGKGEEINKTIRKWSR